MIERELTYLAKSLPDNLLTLPKKEILDVYLPQSAAHATLRVRQNGSKYEITKKEPVIGNDRSEFLEQTIPLTQEEFNELAQLQGKRVHKMRYLLPWQGLTAEVDVFQDDLRGLVLIDFEFETTEEKMAFQMPDFCLAEVTQEGFLAGGMLCGKKYQDISGQLARFEYNMLTV